MTLYNSNPSIWTWSSFQYTTFERHTQILPLTNMNTHMVWEDASIGKALAMQVWGWEFRSPAGQAWRLACNLSSQVAEMGSQGWLARTAKLWAPAQDMMLPYWKTADERQDTNLWPPHTDALTSYKLSPHTWKQTYTHANTDIHIQTFIHICKHRHIFTNTYTHANLYIHTCNPIYKYMKTYIHANRDTHIWTKKGYF